MDIAKLFGVLVVGGSLMTAGAGCDDAQDAPVPDAQQAATVRDGGGGGAPDGATADAAGELVDCGFCPNDMCCEYDEEGAGHTKAGFECCWSTSC